METCKAFKQYLDQNKDKQDMMNQYMQKAQKMAEGGVPSKYKGFSKLPEDVQQKIDPDLASKYQTGGVAQIQLLNQGNTTAARQVINNKLLLPQNIQDAMNYCNTPIDPR